MRSNSSDYLFQVATLDQASQISNLVNSAYRGESSQKGWTTEADLLGGQRTDPDKIKETIEQPGGIILVCRGKVLDKINVLKNVSEDILGVVNLQKKQSDCYLGMLTVRPDLQSRGIGKLLMVESEKWALENGCATISMTVITVREELISFYQRRGFQRTGRYEPFPYGDERFGLPKRPDLQFEVLTKSLS